MVWRLLLLRLSMLLVLGVLGCRDDQVSSTCVADGDCRPDQVCVERVCEPAPEPDPVCEAPCGAACCAGSEVCRNDVCVPDCPSKVWCGAAVGAEVCCADGESCWDGLRCVPPAPECPAGTWEPQLNSCVGPVVARACERAPGTTFIPEVLWRSAPDAFDQAISTPLVADVNGDGVPDVVASFYTLAHGFEGPGIVRAFSGVDGAVLWESVGDAVITPLATTNMAVAQLSSSGPLTVLSVHHDGTLVALDASTGARLWNTRNSTGAPEACNLGWGAVAVADLDGEGGPEIVCGFSVFDSHGILRWRAPGSDFGRVVAVGDLDGNGTRDLTDGVRAYTHDGHLLWNRAEGASAFAAVADFMTAPGDMNLDGVPEVVVIRNGQIELVDARTGSLLTSASNLPSAYEGFCISQSARVGGEGGPPAIADLNGDGTPDVVVASGECIAALTVAPAVGSAQWLELWSAFAIDASSSATAPALADFDADGLADVVYADETRLHFLKGSTGAPFVEALPHCSGTMHELPVVADVDADGSANVVVAANTFSASSVGCDAFARPGVTVYREANGSWANARGLWDQHALNGVRANDYGPYGALGAADLKISHAVFAPAVCPERALRVRVTNVGQAPARVGTPIKVVIGEETVAEASLGALLRPGEATLVTLTFTRDPQFNEGTKVIVGAPTFQAECDARNNEFRTTLRPCELE